MVDHITFTNSELTFDLSVDGPSGGIPVVLLHGFPQDRSTFDPLVARLTDAGYRTYAFDQRGYSPGARPRKVGAYRVRLLLDDLLALEARFELRPFHLVAHDWGGVVGWHAAGRRPDVLRTFTSLSMPHPSAYLRALRRPTQAKAALYAGFFQLPRLPERKLLTGNGERLRRGLISTGLRDDAAARYTENMRAEGALTPALNWYRAAFRHLRGLGAPPSQVPTLYLWGDRDVGLGRAAAEMTGSYVAAPYTFEVLEGASHWLPENHHDEVGELLVRHLARS